MDNRDDRANIAAQIAELEARINSLRIRYEQYFSGAEKRAPINEQETLARELRQMNQRKIIQTELRYRFHNLASRFHVYQGMWERLQRQMDEGRFQRHKKTRGNTTKNDGATTEIERIYQDYSNISKQCHAQMPSRKQLEKFIQQQRENIHAKYGNVQCQFQVTSENGKPKIKVNLKR